MRFRYPAIRSKQTRSDKWLTQLTAPAADIEAWAGVPQKKRFGSGAETAGFQREENPARIKSLKDFYLNQENLIQNPLLGSLRDIPLSSVQFEEHSTPENNENVRVGEVIIDIPNFSKLSFEEILGYVRQYIEARVPELKTREPDPQLVQILRARAAEVGHIAAEEPFDKVEPDRNDEEEGSDADADASEAELSGVLFEESHIVDFWQEIAARHELIKQLGARVDDEEFLGFQREALLQYLRPVVLVDGQHRLRGALAAAQDILQDEGIQSEIETRIAAGEDYKLVESSILRREARLLPMSLLMSTDPAEQVFQFVVVNQKAIGIGRALLGTIVSTTLSNDEMGSVANRLKDAGIQLEESQAVTYLARSPDSPFYGLVERGITGDGSDLLQWNVFASLIAIFRQLKGGRLFHEKRVDYAAKWGQKYLPESPIVADYRRHGDESPLEYWSHLDGPWRNVFIAFWAKIRDTLGNTDDPDSHAYWGRTRASNLFNKISLTILAADFFQFLVETRTTLTSADEVPRLVDQWLEEVNKSYFNRNWNLSGVKKDSTGIKSQWAQLWTEYRKSGGNLPDRRNYRQPRSD